MDVSKWSVVDYLDYFKVIELETRADLALIDDELQVRGLEFDLKSTVDMQKEILARINEGACCEILEVKQSKEGDVVTELAVLYTGADNLLAAKVSRRAEVSDYRYLKPEDKVSEALIKEILVSGTPMSHEERIMMFKK